MAEISKRILTHVEQGKTVREAIDAVIGAGAAEKLIGELFEALKAKGNPTGELCELCTGRPGVELLAVAPLIARGRLGPAWSKRSTIRLCGICAAHN